MQLQHIVSGISSIPDILDPIRKAYNEGLLVNEVKTLDDIDAMNKLVVNSVYSDLARFNISKVNINRMTSHANVIRPFLRYSDKDFFI